MDLIHQDLETPVHNLMDFLGIKFLRNGSVICYVSKEDSYNFSFTFDGTAGGEDLVFEMFWSVGLGLGIVYGRGFFRFL
jgi:hypothetical protein